VEYSKINLAQRFILDSAFKIFSKNVI